MPADNPLRIFWQKAVDGKMRRGMTMAAACRGVDSTFKANELSHDVVPLDWAERLKGALEEAIQVGNSMYSPIFLTSIYR